jgi:DNA-binding NarL/FixJ family response regulator
VNVLAGREERRRVVLADDHAVMRQGLRALLERHDFAVVAEAADGPAAVAAARELRPDVAVLDVAMPGLSGVEAAREIARAAPATRVILLTALPGGDFVGPALRAGVRGFVMKLQGIEELVRAIREVLAGGMYVSPGFSSAVLAAVRAHGGPPGPPGPPGPALSAREREVVRLVAEGHSTKQIAARLGISAKTVEFHRGRAMRKLALHDTAGLVRFAIREGLITP